MGKRGNMSKQEQADSLFNASVYQSNELVEAIKDMNTSTYRLFLLGLSKLRPHLTNNDDVTYDKHFPVTVITHKELKELFKGNSGSLINLKKNLGKAYDTHITINTKSGGFYFEHIYRKMKYEPEIGLQIQFDEAMEPYLLELIDKCYTRFMMKNTFFLESTYAWRLCERMLELQGFLTKHKRKEVSRKFTIEELRTALGVPDGLYEGRMNNFKKRLLDEPIAEINKKTSFSMRYEQYKEGRRIAGFTIFMRFKEGAAIPTVGESDKEPPAIEGEIISQEPASHSALLPADRDGLRVLLKHEKFTDVQINSLLKKWPHEDIRASYCIADEQANKLHLEGRERTKYLKFCVEKNIAAERNQAAEIVQREQDAIAEKKRKEREMSEAFKTAGFATNDEPRGNGFESTGEILHSTTSVLKPELKTNETAETEEAEIEKTPKPKELKPKELTEGQLGIIKGFVKTGVSENMLDSTARGFGYPNWQAMKKARKELRSL